MMGDEELGTVMTLFCVDRPRKERERECTKAER